MFKAIRHGEFDRQVGLPQGDAAMIGGVKMAVNGRGTEVLSWRLG